nr:ISNCY family transposase [Paenibacillus pinihumi]
MKRKYESEGAQGLAHKNRGRKPSHTISDALRDQVTELYQSKYHGSNSCHFAELLQEHETIILSPSSARRILLEKGFKQAKQKRRTKAHPPRQRRAQAGMLWQIDATPHAWLEDRAPSFALHAAIDDATSTVVGAVFRLSECREGYSTVMQEGIKTYGIPLGLYSDRHTIFRSPKEVLTIEQELAGETAPLSHFGKAMAELNIEHVKAITPQAKGRIERLWQTLQDRLVIELRLLGITTIEAANEALPGLIQKHNKQFAVTPRSEHLAYLPLHDEVHLEHVFTIRESRKIANGNTLSYGGIIYTFADPLQPRLDAKTVVEVRQTLSGHVFVWHHGQALLLKQTERPKRDRPQKKKAGSAQPRIPANDHPWKTTYDNNISKRTTKRSTFQEAMYSQHNSYFEASW